MIAERQVNADVRVAVEECGDQRSQIFEPERHGRGNAHHTLRRERLGGSLGFHGFAIVQDADRALARHLAGRRE